MKILNATDFLKANPGAIVMVTFSTIGMFVATVRTHDGEEFNARGTDMLMAILTATDAAQGYHERSK